jgi:hypothetical protein
MRNLSVIAVLFAAACSDAVVVRPAPVARTETADIDGNGHADDVVLNIDEDGWRLKLTFGGRVFDTRTVDHGKVPGQAPWALYIRHGGVYAPRPVDGVQRPPIRAKDDVVIYDCYNGHRMLVWNSPDVGIERIAIR